jgi:hypothetical protein
MHSPVRFADDLRDHEPDFVDGRKDYETADFIGLLGEMATLERDFNNLTMVSSVWLGINSKRGVGGGVRGSSSVNSRSGLYDNIEEVAEGELAAGADDDDDPALAGAVDPIGLRTRLTGTLTQVYVILLSALALTELYLTRCLLIQCCILTQLDSRGDALLAPLRDFSAAMAALDLDKLSSALDEESRAGAARSTEGDTAAAAAERGLAAAALAQQVHSAALQALPQRHRTGALLEMRRKREVRKEAQLLAALASSGGSASSSRRSSGTNELHTLQNRYVYAVRLMSVCMLCTAAVMHVITSTLLISCQLPIVTQRLC